MTIVNRSELAYHRLPGRIIQKAVGQHAASPSERMTMGFARYSAESGPMEPHNHAEEIVYILAAEEGWLRYGPAREDLPHRVLLQPGMILHVPALEWHVFEHGPAGMVDIVYFYGQVNNIRPEEVVGPAGN